MSLIFEAEHDRDMNIVKLVKLLAWVSRLTIKRIMAEVLTDWPNESRVINAHNRLANIPT